MHVMLDPRNHFEQEDWTLKKKKMIWFALPTIVGTLPLLSSGEFEDCSTCTSLYLTIEFVLFKITDALPLMICD